MKQDTFYVVTVPERTRKEPNIVADKRIGYYFCGYVDVPISVKKYYFEKRKKAKKFCLENNYPFNYITKELY